jgi:hypothetical protein
VNAATSAAMVDVLRNHNTTLTELQGLTYEAESHHKEIEWLLALNRYERQFLFHHERVPAGLWPHVLVRIRSDEREDVMYHFVNRRIRRSVAAP